jgi:hypothetical protein
MWIQDKDNKESVNLEHVMMVGPHSYPGAKNVTVYAIRFWSKDMQNYQPWYYSGKEERDNALEHIKLALKPTMIDATRAPLRLE